MKVSVALATYNGAAYLREQLESLVAQKRQPDELIVSDDCSSDQTVEILNNFQRNAPFVVEIYRNQNNLGFSLNFENAIKRCTGDVIFLCDQDDYWYPDKLSTHIGIYAKDKSIHLILNDASICDSHMDKKYGTLQSSISQNLFGHGCCMSFRSELLELILPIPSKYHSHDSWASDLSRHLGVQLITPIILQNYRRHESTVTTIYQQQSKIISSIRNGLLIFKKENLNIEPSEASAKRILFLAEFRDKFISKKEYIIDSITDLHRFNQSLAALDELIRLNAMRIETRKLPFISRLGKASSDYLSGSYSSFKGFQSFIKDVLW